MASSGTQTTINRRQLYHLTNAILNSNSLHFISISLLFLPFTIAASAAFQFYLTFSATTGFDPFNLLLKTIMASSQNLKTLTTSLAFTCFVILSTVAGTASITYTTHQAIHRKPLTFSSTFKSLSHSFLPLLYTFIAGTTKLILLILAITLSVITVNEAIKSLGFHFGIFFSTFVNSIVSYALAITVLFYVVIWGSAAAIAVLESKSGFEALRQSANQSTEFRNHSFSIVFLTGFSIGISLSYSSVSQSFGSTSIWILILQDGVMYLSPSLMILLYVVANTVLYVQCKVGSREDIAETTEEGEVSGEDMVVVNDKDGDGFRKETAKGGFTFVLYLLTIGWTILLCRQLYFIFMLFKI